MTTNNLIKNRAIAGYTYTVNPEFPDNVVGKSVTNDISTQINYASLIIKKIVDKNFTYVGETIKYKLSITNVGNVPADRVQIFERIPNGVSYVPNSLTVSVEYAGDLTTIIQLRNAIAVKQTVYLSFAIQVIDIPIENPIPNQAMGNYSYIVNPENLDEVTKEASSNEVETFIFRYNFGQEITDIINSIANQEKSLAKIAESEAEKIKTMLSRGDVTTQQVLGVNQSVIETLDSMASLEGILKQKLNFLNCQIREPCL